MNRPLLNVLVALFVLVSSASAQKFQVSYTSQAYKGPFTGSVILYLSRTNEQPRNGLGWPCYRITVRNVQPGEAVEFSDSAWSYPNLLSRIGRGEYYVQAVWDIDAGGRVIGTSPGNPYSVSQKVGLGATGQSYKLVCDRTVDTPVFVDTKYVHEIKAPSALLSKFFNKPVTINGAVILPKEYVDQPARRFPLVIIVGGFGAPYLHYSAAVSSDTGASNPLDTTACIKLYLDGDCSLGHSVYANSDNNGPVGDAFATEFLPYLDKHYRTNGARMIRGHSSGGYTVVYLLTHYPKLFVAGNASAPDPVDFRKFSYTDLYLEDHLDAYVDMLTMNRPAVLDSVVYDRPNICHSIEDIFYRGQQNGSFDAVFGPKGAGGMPEPLFASSTLEINRDVIGHWERYDITRYIIRNWHALKPDLDGKLRLSVGTGDFIQNPAVRLMEQEMRKLNAHVEFAYYPGGHFNVQTQQYKKEEAAFLEKRYLEWLAKRNNKR